jgi:GT2 family glycosyltransferase
LEETGSRLTPLVDVVIGTFNRLPFLQLTVKTLRAELEGLPYQLIIVDGGSKDGTTEWLAGQADVFAIAEYDSGGGLRSRGSRHTWGYFMNLGFRRTSAPYVCMVSDDCLVVPGAIRKGLALFEEARARGEKVGAVAFYWRDWPREGRYRVGLTLGDKMFVNHGIYLRQALQEVDFADEETYGFYHADGDLCLKMWERGYTCVASPGSYVEHYAHSNGRMRRSHLFRFGLLRRKQKQDWERYLRRWEGIFYDRTQQNIGRWLEKEFEDPHSTAALFEKA